MKLFRIGIIVIPTSEPAQSEDSELALVAHCVRQHAEREYVLLAALAAHVPDDLLFQWRTVLYEASAVADWMRALDASAGTVAAA